MPRNKVSNNLDYVKKNLKPITTPKGAPLALQPLPIYVPLRITNTRTYSQGYLLDTVILDNPYTIFSLFFSNKAIEVLIRYINKYTFYYSRLEKDYRQFLTTVNKFRAYLGVSIQIDLYTELSILEFQNIDPLRGPIYKQVFKYISLIRW